MSSRLATICTLKLKTLTCAVSSDPVKMQLSITDAGGTDMTFGWGGADVRLNMKLTKVGDIKIGDKTVAIVEKKGDKTTLKSVMVERK